MKFVALVVMLGACEGGTPALRCKTAVERAGETVKLNPKDVTLGIGQCEQEEWSRPARECVAAAKSDEDLEKCGADFNLGGKQGMFASSMSFKKAMKAMNHFADEMCACKDSPCAQQVSDEMTKWSQDQAKQGEPPPKMTEEQVKVATALGERMGKCMQVAMTAGATP